MIHPKSCIFLLVFVMTAWGAGAVENTPAAAPARLRITGTGTALLDGHPYRGAGVNYFDAFSRRLQNPEDTSFRDGFAALARYKIPFARFMCGGFYASEWQYYLDHRDAYFAALDDVIESAHRNGIGLIPSLFWWYPGVPDLAGEPMDQLGNPESKTHAFIRRYTEDVVRRYRNHPAIWAWEFGNEYNLAADLPNAMEHLPPVVPGKGTPMERTVGQNYQRHGAGSDADLCETVRGLDPLRPVTTGMPFSGPPNFTSALRAWTSDTMQEYQQELLRAHPPLTIFFPSMSTRKKMVLISAWRSVPTQNSSRSVEKRPGPPEKPCSSVNSVREIRKKIREVKPPGRSLRRCLTPLKIHTLHWPLYGYMISRGRMMTAMLRLLIRAVTSWMRSSNLTNVWRLP